MITHEEAIYFASRSAKYSQTKMFVYKSPNVGWTWTPAFLKVTNHRKVSNEN